MSDPGARLGKTVVGSCGFGVATFSWEEQGEMGACPD